MPSRLVRGLVVAALVVAAGAAVGSPSVAAAAGLPTVSPTPQDMRPFSHQVTLPSSVRLVVGSTTDPSALSQLTDVLKSAGIRTVGHGAGLSIWVGGAAEHNADSDRQLDRAGVRGPAGLASGGYVLAAGTISGRPEIVLDGVDATGTFYAVQTLRQLIQRHGHTAFVPGVRIRDWPSFAMRSGGETFYGNVWSQADTLSQMRFLGAHKMNAFLYTPSGDTRTAGSNWRTTYPADELAPLAAEVAAAKVEHVDFMYRIDPEAPGDPAAGICHSDPNDLQALVARYEQLWSIGIHTVLVGWDDTSGSFACASDNTQFGGAVSPIAAAQAYVVRYVETHFVSTHPGARFITVPQEYWGDNSSPYRTAFTAGISPATGIFWTGPQVVSPTITRTDLDRASAAFGGRQLLIFDNYPVNDYAGNQQHLGPLVGRDPTLAGAAGGIMANEMQQEEPSLIPLFTIADYAWNAAAYDPQRSWDRSLAEFGGGPALRTYAANSVDSPLNIGPKSPLQQPIQTFLTDYTTGKALPAKWLTGLLNKTVAAPDLLRRQLNDPAFLDESAPWLDKLQLQARAGAAAVQALSAQTRGDRAAVKAARSTMDSDVSKAQAIPQVVAPGVFEQLTDFARTETDRFLNSAPTTVAALAAKQLLAAGATNTVSFTLSGMAPGDLSATVGATGPAGWTVTPVEPTISLHSGNRTVSTTLHLHVVPAAGAGDIVISVAVGGSTLTATTAATVAAAPSGSYPDLVLADHPNGYWRLDDTDADSSGNGNNGADVDAVTRGAPGALAGSADTSVTLNGGYVNVPNSPTVALHGQFTLEAWFRTTVSGQQQGIVERYDTPAWNGELIRIDSDNHLYGYVAASPGNSADVTSASTITPNVWHHVALTDDGTSLKLYLDGFLDASTATTQLPGAGSGDLRLGARGDDTALRLQGSLDEVAAYPSALSESALQGHYLAGAVGG